MKNEISFNINQSSKILFSLPVSLRELFMCDEIDINLDENNKKYLLYTNDCILEAISSFNFLLQKAIDIDNNLHISINQDIGYLWHEYLHDEKSHNFHMITMEEKYKKWIGTDYLLWSSKEFHTWLYSKKGSIIFEITPNYKWHYDEPKKGEKYIPYEEFIKNYKPTFLIEIDTKTAEKWLEETEQILKILNRNEEAHSESDVKND